ncbi:MAG: hypothetical protein ACR2RV_22290 [Verrucomicrobiales bacterium]
MSLRFKVRSLVFLCLLPGLVVAEEATEIGVFVEYIQLGRQAASELLGGYDGDGSALREHLQGMVEREEAQLLDSAYVRTRAWGRSRNVSIGEHIYPTEYDPPEEPTKVFGKIAPGADLIVPSSPTAFDLRFVGNVLEVGANVYAGEDVVELKIASNLAEYTGDSTYGEGAAEAVQPIFDALSSYARVYIKSGQFVLLAAHTPRLDGEVERDRSKRVFVMARATILKRGSGSDKERTGVAVENPFQEDGKMVEPVFVSQVGVLVEHIQLEAATATKLVREHAADADASVFRERVEGLIKAGEAEQIDSAYILNVSGERAKTESVHELIYPTEYDPPGIPSSIPTDGQAGGFPITPSPAQAFDVRNVGSSFQVEPSWREEQRLIDLNIAPQRVSFVGFIHYGDGEALTQQPVFSVMKVQSNLRVPEGAYTLAAVQSPRDESADGAVAVRSDPSKRVLTFLKASLMRLPVAVAEGGEDE